MRVVVSGVRTDLAGLSGKVHEICTDDSTGLFMATEAMRGMNDYVPFRNGYLSASAMAKPFEVSYRTAYARYCYYGDRLNFRRERHAHAQAHWDQAYQTDHAADLANAVTAYLKR